MLRQFSSKGCKISKFLEDFFCHGRQHCCFSASKCDAKNTHLAKTAQSLQTATFAEKRVHSDLAVEASAMAPYTTTFSPSWAGTIWKESRSGGKAYCRAYRR